MLPPQAGSQNAAISEVRSIVVVDSNSLQRGCFARILRGEFQDYIILETECLHRLEPFVGKQVAAIALNIGSAAEIDDNVCESLTNLRQNLPDGPVILLTELQECTLTDAMIAEASRFGVKGCIARSSSVDIAVAALRLVIAGGTYFPREIAPASAAPPALRLVSSENSVVTQTASNLAVASVRTAETHRKSEVAFTEREQQIVATLQRGLPNKIIAHELKMSQNTVKTHISRIMRKLAVSNRTEAALAVQKGG